MKSFLFPLAALIATPFVHADEVKIEITGNDQMQYSTKTIEVTTGQKVTLSLKHIGQIPVIAMGHNVVILKAGTEIPAFAAKCATAKDTGYIPQDEESKAQILAHTKLLGGGESDTITFTAPEPGSYPYVYALPRSLRPDAGVMTVKAK